MLRLVTVVMLVACAGDGQKSSDNPDTLGSKNINGEDATALASTNPWTKDSTSIRKFDVDQAAACSPGSEQVTYNELGDRTYERVQGKLSVDVCAKAAVVIQLSGQQRNELEAALAALKVVVVKATTKSANCARSTPRGIGLWSIKQQDGTEQRFYTQPTSDCADSKVLTNVETVNRLIDNLIKQSGKVK
jgi:hypothetical protein